MIITLDHKNRSVAQVMKTVFERSYAIEAQLLKADDFPPLKRTLCQYSHTDNVFYGHFLDEALTAVVEIAKSTDSIDIQSLVVDPDYFRKGIASQLLQDVLDRFESPLFTVETGSDNVPAVALYKKYGFIKTREYKTNHGIRKVCFELKPPSKKSRC